jgi:hypothetical protein
MAKGRNEAMRCEEMSGGFTPPVFASKCVKADILQELLRQHVVPWVQRDIA